MGKRFVATSAAETFIGVSCDAARNVTIVEANTTNTTHPDFHLELVAQIILQALDFIL